MTLRFKYIILSEKGKIIDFGESMEKESYDTIRQSFLDWNNIEAEAKDYEGYVLMPEKTYKNDTRYKMITEISVYKWYKR